MAIKKHKWMKYGSRGHIIEIKIKDESERTIDTFKCNNRKAFRIIANIIESKYGFSFKPDFEKDRSNL